MEKMNIEFGNPKKRFGYITVDLNPIDKGVIQSDAVEYLKNTQLNFDIIESYNLLEHLKNPYEFLELCYKHLNVNGKLITVTDNAEWLPFYLPFIHSLGFGAHESNLYKYKLFSKDAKITKHYYIFAPLHLKNLLEDIGFRNITITRITFFARLKAEATK